MLPLHVTLYTRVDCTLCQKARAAIESAGVPLVIDEIDIDQSAELLERYTNDVPIIFVDGVEAFRHSVDSGEFARYAAGLQRAPLSLLAGERCVPCRGGVPPLEGQELDQLVAQLAGQWRVIANHHLEKTFRFPDFAKGLAFTNVIGTIAEEQGHHPDLHLRWGEVRVEIWTHAIDGLTRSDFVLAARIDAQHLLQR